MNIVEEKFVQETKQADIDHHKPTAGAMVGHVLANFKLEEMKLIQAQLYVLGTSSQELSTLFSEYADQEARWFNKISHELVIENEIVPSTLEEVMRYGKIYEHGQNKYLPASTMLENFAKDFDFQNVFITRAIDKKITQIIGVSDVIRPEVAEQLAKLKQAGAKQLVMLTGDNQMTADYVADMLGIDEVHAELLPDEKVQFVKKYQEQGLRVAFIGDGINDSPSLAAADIGIAMGSGTDVAIETSDVVLMQSNFESLVHAYRLAKKTVLNTRENVVIAIGVVLFLLIGLFAGFIYMASGMFVHEASILIVIFNAMRLLYFGHESKEEKS